MSWVAGIVVIGDEMLSGKVKDTNTPFLCRELHQIGWTVRKVRALCSAAQLVSRGLCLLSRERLLSS
jgi:molybdopterin-biosynthesis enzyme MoeA-like protein